MVRRLRRHEIRALAVGAGGLVRMSKRTTADTYAATVLTSLTALSTRRCTSSNRSRRDSTRCCFDSMANASRRSPRRAVRD